MAAATETDPDGLFQLPLSEFTAARNALASRLKKSGRSDEAERVKAFAKPSVSAWVVNQLYWKHRDAFDRLMKAGDSYNRANALQLAGKTADVRGTFNERQEALSSLSRTAEVLLQESGHAAAPDTMRRIATTLEALSIYTSLPEGPRPGTLTADLNAPPLWALAGLFPASAPPPRPARAEPPAIEEKARPDPRLFAAKSALAQAERALEDARAKAEAAGKDWHHAKDHFERAVAAAETARRRHDEAAAEAKHAAKQLEAAERDLEKARNKLQDLS